MEKSRFSTLSRWNLALLLISSSILGLKNFVPMTSVFMPGTILTLLIVVLFLSIVFCAGANRFIKYLFSSLPIFAVEVFTLIESFFVSDGNTFSAFVTILMLIVWPVLSFFLLDYRNHKEIKRLSLILLFVLVAEMVFTMITTYRGNLVYPGASRALAHYDTDTTGVIEIYTAMNIGGFAFIYSLTVLFPFLIYWTKLGWHKKIIGTGVALLAIICIISSQYTIALLLSAVSIFLYFAPKHIQRSRISLYVLLFLTVLFGVYFLSDVLLSLSERVEGLTMSSRLSELSDILSGKGIDSSSDSATRAELLHISWNNFLNNILFGTTAPAGGHSYLLDTLSRFGLLGLVALIISFRYLYTRFVKPFENCELYIYALAAFVINIIQCFMNTFNGYVAFTLVLPLFAVLFTGPSISKTINIYGQKN